MYCTKCNKHYPDDYIECPICLNSLEKEPIRNQIEYQELYPIYTPPDASLLAIAKSLLESEGIEFWVQNEKLQNLLGAGQLMGFNQIFGSPKIYVNKENIKLSKELLKDLTVINDNQKE